MKFILKFLKRVLARQRQNREIRSMSDLQSADLAMNKSDLFAYTNARLNAPEQMKLMAQEFGLSPDTTTKEHWRQLEIVHNCNHCEHHKKCYQYLTTGSGFAKESCPNSVHYEALRNQDSD